MNEHEHDAPLEEVPAQETKPLPMLVVRGEGYVTRQNGEVVHFTIQGEG